MGNPVLNKKQLFTLIYFSPFQALVLCSLYSSHLPLLLMRQIFNAKWKEGSNKCDILIFNCVCERVERFLTCALYVNLFQVPSYVLSSSMYVNHVSTRMSDPRYSIFFFVILKDIYKLFTHNDNNCHGKKAC